MKILQNSKIIKIVIKVKIIEKFNFLKKKMITLHEN